MSTALTPQASDRRQIEEVRAWAIDHLQNDLRVERLADQAAMSPRHFARVLRHEAGTRPALYSKRLRVEAAQRRLEESRDRLAQIARTAASGPCKGCDAPSFASFASRPTTIVGKSRTPISRNGFTLNPGNR